jgi:hypothetical protein
MSPAANFGNPDRFLTVAVICEPLCVKLKPDTPVTLEPLSVALTKVAVPRPAGNVSTMLATSCALDPPVLVRVSTYTTAWPTVTGELVGVLLVRVSCGLTTVKGAVAVSDVRVEEVEPELVEFCVTHCTSARFTYAPGTIPPRTVAR